MDTKNDLIPLKIPGHKYAYVPRTFDQVLKAVYIGPIKQQMQSRSLFYDGVLPATSESRYATVPIHCDEKTS